MGKRLSSRTVKEDKPYSSVKEERYPLGHFGLGKIAAVQIKLTLLAQADQCLLE